MCRSLAKYLLDINQFDLSKLLQLSLNFTLVLIEVVIDRVVVSRDILVSPRRVKSLEYGRRLLVS